MPTKYEGTEEEKRVLNTFIKMMRASNSISARLARALAKEGITVSQFGVLETLLHLGPLNQKELGKKLLKSGGNITMVIDNLVKNGYVTREIDPCDRRAVIVKLTNKGEAHIREYFPRHLENVMEIYSILTPEETEELGRLCKKIGTAK